ncbi:glycosyltransferase [Actinosynnema sp. NPDC020468]|uniref:glycosyltransferase family 2 protein n=1 Tax=Actinosynnema sp. NPDC020468 TaxID=3154488 RepID=UPI0033FC74D3
MSVAFVSYVCVIVVPFLRHRPRPDGDPAAFRWHFLVPCLDEEAVIGDTVRYLRREFPQADVWVVDDDSFDGTVAEVTRLRDDRVHLVRRRLPAARRGKGDALNAGYRALLASLDDFADPDLVVVAVVDADGRPAANCLAACAAEHLFGDPAVGAVQIDVRMGNRDAGGSWFGRALVRMQDLEFRTAIAAIQLSRRYSGTISMGGNGQFTRLTALMTVDDGDSGAPWRGSLLEDFELGVHLLTAGWRTAFTVDTHVDQEALPHLRRFLAQRTRWGQGTMQCARYLRRIWSSRHISTLGAAEMLYYLAQPWLQLLGTLVYPVPFVLLAVRASHEPEVVWGWLTGGAWILFVLYGTFGLLPFLIWGPIYRRRCEHRSGVLRGLGYGVLYALYILSFYLTSWRALCRLVRGHDGWVKTARNASTEAGPVRAP